MRMGATWDKKTHPREDFAMTPASKQAGWGFWLLWVAASTVGFALGSIAHQHAGKLLTDTTPALIALTVTVGLYPLIATLPGFLHWLILRRWFSNAGWWVLASSISWVVAEYAYLKLTRAGDVRLLWGAAVSGALSGAITGFTLVGLMRKGGQRNAP